MACNGLTYSSGNSCGGSGSCSCLWTILIIAVIVLWLQGGGLCNWCSCLCGGGDC